METPELQALNVVLTQMKHAGIPVQIGHLYGTEQFDLFIALPKVVILNGHGFELAEEVREKDGEEHRSM